MRRALACLGFACGVLVVSALTAPGCGSYGGTAYPEGGVAGPKGGSVGASCSTPGDCRQGLTCTANKCAPCGCSPTGTACIINDECATGQYCGPAKTCVAGGTGAAGSSCHSDSDCAVGLRCDVVGLGAECKPEGTGDLGAACGTSADCFGGLACTMGTCQSVPAGEPPFGVPTWPGATCTDPSGQTQAYFRVPRGTADDGDFYRLPFPNDVRKDGTKISLTGHPTPGPGLIGVDLVAAYISDLEATVDGFSTYPTVFLRFSAPIDIYGTLKASGAVRFTDITNPQAPVDQGLDWIATTDRNAYICNNYIALRPPQGQALIPGHTYSVFVASSVVDANKKAILPPPDLVALLAATSPSDAALAPQWPKYALFRAWLQQQNMTPSSVLDAAVFTVGHPAAIGPALATAVAAAPLPAATGWVDCSKGASPCPQATGDRACGTANPAFSELHALVSLPIFQKGTEPYATPTDGGDLVLNASGVPQLQRSEQVCMSMTVPKGSAMPAAGWPLLVYAHGTGGSFRSEVTEGVAARMAAKGVAVLGIDQVEHGTRRGTSTGSPDNLFYNFANPAAARGNPLQGAADQMSLVRFATGFDLPGAQSPTQAEIKIGAVAFWGHSQGATEGGIAMPFVSGVCGAVMSGQGASLMDALVTKTNPVDIAAALPIALSDAKVDSNHPVVALLQNDFNVVDPLNYAQALVQTPAAAADQKHVFQPYGQGDTYAPTATQQTFAMAAQLGEAMAPSGVTPDKFLSTAPLPVPAGGNATVNGVTLTALLRQYAP
ncbi:MAG TPA: dickkopf-related protein, partial [Polyangiaceae bacterium]